MAGRIDSRAHDRRADRRGARESLPDRVASSARARWVRCTRRKHVKVGRPFAVKVLHPRLLEDRKVLQRFEREAELAGRLRHPNVDRRRRCRRDRRRPALHGDGLRRGRGPRVAARRSADAAGARDPPDAPAARGPLPRARAGSDPPRLQARERDRRAGHARRRAAAHRRLRHRDPARGRRLVRRPRAA